MFVSVNILVVLFEKNRCKYFYSAVYICEMLLVLKGVAKILFLFCGTILP